MRKFIAILIVLSAICLVACAPKTGGKEGTPTPDNKDNTQATATPSAGPGDPDFSIDLEEDVLEGGEATPEATGTSQTEPTNTQAPSNTQLPTVTGSAGSVATATPDGNSTSVGNSTPVVTATPKPSEQPIISLPMDFF